MRTPDRSLDGGRGSDFRIDARRTSTVQRLAGILGQTVAVGADMLTETAKLGMYTSGRIVHGIKSTRQAASDGLAGNGYPTGK